MYTIYINFTLANKIIPFSQFPFLLENKLFIE